MKQNQLSVNDFYAKDVFKGWVKLVKKAKISITIYSPYINQAVNELIGQVREKVKIEIITRLDEDSLSINYYQLEALIKAMSEQGASIFHLPELHAKILLVDDKFVSIGSQNFTSGGRDNKEASFVSKFPFSSDSEFLQSIKEWKGDVRNVHKNELQELLEKLKEDWEDFQKRKLKLKKKIEEIKEKHSKRNERNLITERTAILTHYDGNKNLQCRRKEHLTNWEKKRKSAALNKGYFYPVINLDTYQMIYARVSKTVISFVDYEIVCNNDVEIGSEMYSVEIDFPEVDTKESNINMYFENSSGRRIKLRYFFDGKEFELKSNGDTNKSEKRKIIQGLESRKDILFSLFEPVHVGVMNKKHIVEKFATKYKYEAKIRITGEVEIISIKSKTE